jgi:hypothetical protein
MHQILAMLFNLVLLIYYTINSYTNRQTAFKVNAETSMITKLLLTLHLLGHLAAWITIRYFLNEFTYFSISLSVLICLFTIKLGNKNRQIWIEAHTSPGLENINLNALVASWITPASFLTDNCSKLLFKDLSTLQRRRIIGLPLRRKIMIVFTAMATALIQLVHFSSITLLLNLTDVFEPSSNIIEAR